jgi:hypothetical protein
MTASWSTPAGSGVWTVMPETWGSRLRSRTSATIFAWSQPGSSVRTS